MFFFGPKYDHTPPISETNSGWLMRTLKLNEWCCQYWFLIDGVSVCLFFVYSFFFFAVVVIISMWKIVRARVWVDVDFDGYVDIDALDDQFS